MTLRLLLQSQAAVRTGWETDIMTLTTRRIRLSALLCSLVFCWIASTSVVRAQNAAQTDVPPPQLRQALELLDDPVIRDWLARRASVAANAPSPSPSSYFDSRLTASRVHLLALIEAIPRLPQEFEQARMKLLSEARERGFASTALMILVFIVLGFGSELLFNRLFASTRRKAGSRRISTVSERLQVIAVELVFNVGSVVAFSVGSLGAFVAVDWPPLLRQICIPYLLAFVVIRSANALLGILLAPRSNGSTNDADAIRVIPMSTPAARFWTLRIGLLIGWFVFGWATILMFQSLQFTTEAWRLVAYGFGIGLIVIGVESIWRFRPATKSAAPGSAAMRWIGTVVILLMWLAWVMAAFHIFWLLTFAAGLPLATVIAHRAVRNVLRPHGETEAATDSSSIVTVCIERGIRAALMIGAIFLLTQAWGLNLADLAGDGTPAIRILRGALHALIILLVFDLAWSVLKAILDEALETARKFDTADTNEALRRARIRTLLPILRNMAFIVLLIMGLLMALAALGVEIGPLIASAGVVGIAVGFGAQTLFRDIFSGVFYLLDDAFRVGEYIQSGRYKGVVESFSLRSIRLRHQRGPLSTVPFGELGAIENMSRDWVIDKMSISVAYGSDFDKAKKIVKQIGKELAQDPELAADILEPLKMQGVDEFGDFGIKIRLKVMTRPGKQFVVRRRANAMIKRAFDANGIAFAVPIVQVAGGGDASAAAAHTAVDLLQPTEAKI